MPESVLSKAQRFAEYAHRDQERKFQGVPYVWHCHAVSKLVEIYSKFDYASTVDLRVAALLHDTIEDTHVNFYEIEKKFGSRVAELVEELTSDKEEIEDIGKAEYLANKMINMSDEALLIKLCDRLDNLSDYKMVPIDFRTRCALETEEILVRLQKNRNLSSVHKRLVAKLEKYCEWSAYFRKDRDPC